MIQRYSMIDRARRCAVLLAVLAGPATVAAGVDAGVAELGRINGLALACGERDIVAATRAAMIERVAKTREAGEAFEQATNGAFLTQSAATTPCPTRPELAVALELAVTKLASPPSAGATAEAAPAAVRNPRYLLQDVNGRAILDSDFHGRFQLITFGYTFCPDICPTTLVEMAGVLKALGERAERLQPIFVSVDPERDTLPVLRAYTAFFDKRILGATASLELLRRSAESFGVRFDKVQASSGDAKNYTVDHTAGMQLLGPDGQLLARFAYATPVPAMVERILAEMQARPPAPTAAR